MLSITSGCAHFGTEILRASMAFWKHWIEWKSILIFLCLDKKTSVIKHRIE